jgi:antitoxin component YwqK of YwqJK toxin-antitoxin module
MGKRHGHWIKYDPEGRVQVEAGFDNDQKHGVLRVYAADGSVKSETTWDHGQRRS